MAFDKIAARYPNWTEMELYNLRCAMAQVWDYIAADCMSFMDDPYDLDDQTELICDADRLRESLGSWVAPEVRAAGEKFYTELKASGYTIYPDLPRALWRLREGVRRPKA